jgi:hypothetical protein
MHIEKLRNGARRRGFAPGPPLGQCETTQAADGKPIQLGFKPRHATPMASSSLHRRHPCLSRDRGFR